MIAYKSADQLAKLIKDKEISSVELLDYYISRVEKYNSDINAIIVKDYENAKQAAKKADDELSKGNILGTQFHPELSRKEGLIFLKNFCNHF